MTVRTKKAVICTSLSSEIVCVRACGGGRPACGRGQAILDELLVRVGVAWAFSMCEWF